jgi:hypothetical protein
MLAAIRRGAYRPKLPIFEKGTQRSVMANLCIPLATHVPQIPFPGDPMSAIQK